VTDECGLPASFFSAALCPNIELLNETGAATTTTRVDKQIHDALLLVVHTMCKRCKKLTKRNPMTETMLIISIGAEGAVPGDASTWTRAPRAELRDMFLARRHCVGVVFSVFIHSTMRLFLCRAIPRVRVRWRDSGVCDYFLS